MSHSEFDRLPFGAGLLFSMRLDVVFNGEDASSEHHNSVRKLILQFLERLEKRVHTINLGINNQPMAVNRRSANFEWLTHFGIRRMINNIEFNHIDCDLGCIDSILDSYKTNGAYRVKSIVFISKSNRQMSFDHDRFNRIADRINSMREKMHVNVVVIAPMWNSLHTLAANVNGLSLNLNIHLSENDLHNMIKTMTREPTLVCRGT